MVVFKNKNMEIGRYKFVWKKDAGETKNRGLHPLTEVKKTVEARRLHAVELSQDNESGHDWVDRSQATPEQPPIKGEIDVLPDDSNVKNIQDWLDRGSGHQKASK